MSSPKSLLRRSKSSTRVLLARDLHDSLAQTLVAIGYKLDLLVASLPIRYRAAAREIRFLVNDATQEVRRELFNLRAESVDFPHQLQCLAKPLPIEIHGELEELDESAKRIVQELVRNASLHSKGRSIKVEISKGTIKVSDDGQGLFGISELVFDAGGQMEINCSRLGTVVEIKLP